MGSLAQINVRFKADLSGFSNEMQNSMRRLQAVGTQMTSIGKSMSTFITLPLLAAGAGAVKFASDYEESMNKVNVAFGPASESVKAFAKDSLTSFGLAEGSALDAAAMYGDMATSMGLNQSEAAKMSTELVGLAGDLASFKNIGIDQANTALTGIFSGETESLKKLGIVLTEANLQQFALSKGIKTQVKDMDQASKVNLRYAYIMANTTNAQGDFLRTGGGAANQTRVFTEGLKQLGQQFGDVILPYFTKAITYLNGLLKGFSELSPATKAIIVGVAGLAAAIGPLMVGLGNVIGIIPKLIVQFTALKATIIANPYVAAAVAIGAIGLAIYSYVSSTKEAVSAQTSLNDAIKKGNEAAASEVGTLDKLYATATNVKVSTIERKKAVDDLQAIYPAYFKNIKDEAILNGTATTSYNQLRDAIFNKSRAVAIDAELQSRANDRIQKEMKLRQDIAFLKEKIEKDYTKTYINEAGQRVKVIDEYYGELASAEMELKKFNEDNLKADSILFSAKEDYLKKTGKLQENEAQKLSDIKVGTDAITAANERQIKSGTIEFYEAQISALQKLRREQADSNPAVDSFDKQIDAIQKKIDALTNKGIKLPKPTIDFGDVEAPPAFSLGDLENEKIYYEGLRTEFSTTSAEYDKYTDLINNTQLKINAITGVEETVTQIETVKTSLQSFNESVTAVMNSTVTSFTEGFGQVVASWANGGDILKGLGSLFLSTLADMMIQVGKIAIQTGIAVGGIKSALKSLNPAVAIGAGVALIALGSLVKSQMSDAGGFANGGMVGGTSYSGDKLFARVNSGEMILNQKQQRNLSNMINPAVTAGDMAIQLMGGFEIEGSKLRLVLDRTDKKNNRLG